MPPKIRILIADDHASVRESYAISLQLEEHIEVIATAENGEQAIEYSLTLQPDIVLMDLHMPVMNGLEATKILKKKCPIDFHINNFQNQVSNLCHAAFAS